MTTPKKPLLTPRKRWTPPGQAQPLVRPKGKNPMPVILLLVFVGGGVLWLLSGPTNKQTSGDSEIVVYLKPATRNAAPQPAVAEPADSVSPPAEEFEDAPMASAFELPKEEEDSAMPPEPEEADAVAEKADSDRFENEPVLVLTGTDAESSAEIARDQKLLEEAVSAGAWEEYRGFLERSLQPVLAGLPEPRNGNRFAPLWNHPVFLQAFLRQQVLTRFSSSEIRSAGHSDTLLSWILKNNPAMEELLLTLQSGDDSAKVLEFLSNVYYDSPALAEKYINLAIACAVVFDRQVRIQAASAPGQLDGQPFVNGMTRYHWYVDRSEKRKLAVPANQSSARDLVWVVCAPVPDMELDWAIDKMRLRRQNWGNAYGSVSYLMERAVNGLNPYKEYSFAEILKEGGICSDQSYFCVNTARANGIPAIVLSGETDLGPHAWAAVKTKPDEWDTSIGRIGGVADGGGHHPQTGGRINEQEVWLWNERGQKSDATRLTTFRLLWLADILEQQKEEDLAAEAVGLANSVGRDFPETWSRLHGLLAAKSRDSDSEDDGRMLSAWKEFVSGMRSRFRDNPRMSSLASEAELEFILPHLPEEEARRILASSRRQMNRRTDEQKDLVADAVKAEADLISSGGSTDALDKIGELYNRSLRNYGSNITAFKRMSEDYFSFVREDSGRSTKAARDIESAFFRVVETGSKNWFRANTEVSIYRMICEYHRHAGDEERAVRLERRYTRLLQSAERGALR